MQNSLVGEKYALKCTTADLKNTADLLEQPHNPESTQAARQTARRNRSPTKEEGGGRLHGQKIKKPRRDSINAYMRKGPTRKCNNHERGKRALIMAPVYHDIEF